MIQLPHSYTTRDRNVSGKNIFIPLGSLSVSSLSSFSDKEHCMSSVRNQSRAKNCLRLLFKFFLLGTDLHRHFFPLFIYIHHILREHIHSSYSYTFIYISYTFIIFCVHHIMRGIAEVT